MDAEALHRGLLLWSGPLNHTHVREMIDDAIATAYRAGIEAAANVVDDEQWNPDRTLLDCERLTAKIRALAPAATTEEP